ncbi:spore germination protein [Neobacillus pocheonensis]|uniref:Spore germination protein n=1 Tax=Neobacillus pocheonensis TaxID=363869 RepID=A0ABT0WC10_9BACI|nr:spore germination protein [Neobacillus pocheonensis]
MGFNQDGVKIGTVSGGIVNFGGAIYISPISITKSITGSGGNNSGGVITTNSGLELPIKRV